MPNTFNPAEWLADFVQLGGAYVVSDSNYHLWLMDADENLRAAQAHVARLTPACSSLLAEHLRSLELVEG